MTSGRSAAIFSNRMPSVFVNSSGGSPAAFAASCAHGPMPFSKPIQSVTPTGATPSAKNASCSLSPTLTMRCGRSVISVVPYLCSIATGNAAGASLEDVPRGRSSADDARGWSRSVRRRPTHPP
jgi:hypothetical protein